ncbi:hypothetical protein ACLOJK_024054 [Asimina triloba]
MGSGGEVFVTVGRAGATLINESVSVVPVAHSPGSSSHISLPLSTLTDLLFSGGGVDDLNVDNVDWPLRIPGANAPILFDSFFSLASLEHAERSPSSVHRAGSSGDGGILEIEGLVRHRVSFPDGVAALKGADVVSGRVAKPVAPVQGGAVEVIVPDSDEDLGDNSSLWQHVPTEGVCRVTVGEVTEATVLVGAKTSYAYFSSFRDGFIEAMDALSDPDDLNHLLDLCNTLEQSLRTFGAKFLNLEQEVNQRSAFTKEDKCQYHLALEIKNQLIKECDAKVALVNATKAHSAKIDVELPSYQKDMEERGAVLLMHSAHLKEV